MQLITVRVWPEGKIGGTYQARACVKAKAASKNEICRVGRGINQVAAQREAFNQISGWVRKRLWT